MKDQSLSQKEIDALLSVLPTEGEPVPEDADKFVGSARTYDFSSPDTFAKEQTRTLQIIHENMARRVSSSLSAYLRTTVHATFVYLEQGRFTEFADDIPSPTIVAVLEMDPLPGRILLTLEAAIATIALDRLLGGSGGPIQHEHEITDIEGALLRRVVEYITDGIREAWSNVITLSTSIAELELNPEFVQITFPSDTGALVGFELRVGDHTGMMAISIPYSVLKPIVSELSPSAWVAGADETSSLDAHREELRQHLHHVPVQARVLLGEIDVPVEELIQVQVDDVLVLDTAVSQPLSLHIGAHPVCEGRPGLSGKRLALQIDSVVGTEASKDE